MSFYTNVSTIGNSILFRGVSKDGKRFKDRIEYHPTLYIPTKEETKFQTLEGDPVGEIQPGTMKECREFIARYKEIDNFNIYGNDKFEYSFIAEHFPEKHIDYDFASKYTRRNTDQKYCINRHIIFVELDVNIR